MAVGGGNPDGEVALLVGDARYMGTVHRDARVHKRFIGIATQYPTPQHVDGVHALICLHTLSCLPYCPCVGGEDTEKKKGKGYQMSHALRVFQWFYLGTRVTLSTK